MKIIVNILISLILFLVVPVRSSLSQGFISSETWKEYKGDHFIIYYNEDIPKDYIKKFEKECEKDYDTVLDRMGFSRTDFWLFEDRAKVYLFRNRADYLEKTGFPEFTAAAADYETGYIANKIIITYYQNEGFFENMLPHELSHIILKDYIGTNIEIPLWFNEGVACSSEKDNQKYGKAMDAIIRKDPDLTDTVGRDMTPYEFYSVSASYVMFLLREYGRRKFVDLCRELKNRKPFDTAFEEVYGIEDMNELRSDFLEKHGN